MIGTRAAMLKYLEILIEEIKVWYNDTKCQAEAIDQSVHNYLYYTGKLPFARAIPSRMGTVNTCGRTGMYLVEDIGDKPFPGANNRTWIGIQYNLTDAHGFFTQLDGTRSRVVHQADHFGPYFWDHWLAKQPWVTD